MKKFSNIKSFVLWTALFSFTYLVCCPLTPDNIVLTIIINHIPFLALAVIDVFVLCQLKTGLFTIIKHYIKINNAVVIGVMLYLLYDILTIIWAVNPEYSIWKYVLFTKTAFLILSMCLLLYDSDYDEFRTKTEIIIKNMGLILPLVIITTVIKYENNTSPFLFRVSLIEDYNVYGNYLIFLLVLFAFYFIQNEHKFSAIVRIIYVLFIIAAIDTLMLAGSRRIVVVLPVLIFLAVITIAIKNLMLLRKNREGHSKASALQKNIILTVISIIIILNMHNVIPVFQNHAEHKLQTQIAAEESNNENEADSSSDVTDNGSKDTTDISEKNRGEGEGYLETGYNTIKGDTGMQSRHAIWRVAIDEIKRFDLQEFIIGKGNGYSWSLYEDKNNEQAKALAECFGVEIFPQWMTPHNIFLREMLDGGIIKILLLLFIGITVFVYLIKYMRKDYVYGIMLLCLYISIGASFILGSTHGLLGEDLFWLATGLLVLLRTSASDKKELSV